MLIRLRQRVSRVTYKVYEFINEHIDECQRFFAVTFDGSVTTKDKQTARQNFAAALDLVSGRCEKTAHQIGGLDLTVGTGLSFWS